MPLSQHTAVSLIANIFGIIPVGFGINCFLRPNHALSFFHLEDLRVPGDQQLVDYVMYIYGIRDIFMGVATWLTLYYGSRKALGGVLLGVAGIAFVDGLVCKMHGEGEWDHWGYAPIVAGTGLVAMGVLD